MSTLYEYYNTGDDADDNWYQDYWAAQTFAPAIAHKITSVKLLLWRKGSPGTIIVSIRATDADGHPTGEDLCSGTTDGNTLPTSEPYEWREITLGAGYNLEANVKYAIVARAPDGYALNYPWWRYDSTSPAYTKGNCDYSEDGGLSWYDSVARDSMFEEWGEVVVTEKFSSDSGIAVEHFRRVIEGETAYLTASFSQSEIGAGIESIIGRLIALRDQGKGTDLAQLISALTSQDMAVGAEISSLLAQLLKIDSGIGIENIISRIIALTDAGLSIETSMLFANLTAQDIGVAVEIAQLVKIIQALYSSDAGVGTDTSSLMVKLFKSDLSIATDSSILLAAIAVADSGIGLDKLVELYQAFLSYDVGAGIDKVISLDTHRLLRLIILTAQYRRLLAKTAQYRKVDSKTAQFRKVDTKTSQPRRVDTKTSQHRRIDTHTTGD